MIWASGKSEAAQCTPLDLDEPGCWWPCLVSLIPDHRGLLPFYCPALAWMKARPWFAHPSRVWSAVEEIDESESEIGPVVEEIDESESETGAPVEEIDESESETASTTPVAAPNWQHVGTAETVQVCPSASDGDSASCSRSSNSLGSAEYQVCEETTCELDSAVASDVVCVVRRWGRHNRKDRPPAPPTATSASK